MINRIKKINEINSQHNGFGFFFIFGQYNKKRKLQHIFNIEKCIGHLVIDRNGVHDRQNVCFNENFFKSIIV